VHYWNDHGYGSSVATIRIYIWGQLIYEEGDVALSPLDMWEVGSIHWPQGEVVPACAVGAFPDTCPKKITPDYENPIFAQP
jgi:hypothetical protein